MVEDLVPIPVLGKVARVLNCLVTFILASESPRRCALLTEAGFTFRTVPAHLDEERLTPPDLSPSQIALHLARLKADTVSRQFPGELVLAADTVVEIDGVGISKPADADDARRMIRMLAGRTHQVITGLCLRWRDRQIDKSRVSTSIVRLRSLTDAELERYIATNLWKGKAGGYGIQDPEPLVELISGSYSNVMGLPMEETSALLGELLPMG